MGSLTQDIRYSLRALRRSPAFTATAVLVLALGIGATTSMFSVVHATLLRPLPFPDPDRLATLYMTVSRPGRPLARQRWSYPEFEAMRASVRGFQGVAAMSRAGFNLTGGGHPDRVQGEVVSSSYFGVLGVEPMEGRAFTLEDDRTPGGSPVALLSHRFSRDRLGSDAGVVGGSIRLNGVSLTVVGVLPEGFYGLTGRSDVWITHAMGPVVDYPGQLTTTQHFLTVVGRLGEGTSFAEAEANLASLEPVIEERFGAEHEGGGRWSATLTPLDEARIDPDSRRSRVVLFGAVVLVLLIAGANLAGLLLGRGLSRHREMTIRRALGSSRSRLVCQALTESTILGLLGGGGGMLLTLWLTGWARSVMPEGGGSAGAFGRLSQFAGVSVDAWVIAFALALSILVGLVFGVGPALRATRGDANLSLRGADPGDGFGRATGRWLPGPFSFLVLSEFALALTLLVGAGLLLETMANLGARQQAFATDDVVSFRISPPMAQYGPPDGPPLLEQVLERVSAVPGVSSASVGPCAPFMDTCAWREVRRPPDEAPEGRWSAVRRHYVGPEHFRTLGIALLRGRAITDGDRPGSPNVGVVNRHLAETLWPGEDPLGKRLVLWGGNFIGEDSVAVVVGVVEDVPYGAAGEATSLDLYTSYHQFAWPFTYVHVRAGGRPAASLIPALRQALQDVDAELPVFDVATLDQRAHVVLSTSRFNSQLLGGFAALALLLAGVGIYGVMSQFVTRRIREMGIRMAIGADRSAVLALVLRRGVTLAAGGVAAGAVGAWILARLLASQLYGVSTTDPLAFAGAAVFLLLVGLLAVLLPARVATRVDPVVVLRAE